MSTTLRLGSSLLLAALSFAAVAENLNSDVYRQDNATFDQACTEEGNITISGNNNDATISGPCEIVEIIGSGNKVHIYRTAAIDVKGENNQVDWRNSAKENAKPIVKNDGAGNTVITFDEWLSKNGK